jgi:hypothetical protein
MKFEFTEEQFNMFIYCLLPPSLTDNQLHNYIKKGIPTYSDEFQDRLFTVIRKGSLLATKLDAIDDADFVFTDEQYECIFQIICKMIQDNPRVFFLLMPTYREDLIRCFDGEHRLTVKMETSAFYDIIKYIAQHK